MSVDKLVDSTQLDSDLTEVADEIRTAGGTLLPLSFPDDYVVAIGDIGNTEIKTASGSIAHFEDALARKAQDLTVAIEPVQSGSGDPSPDNVRPISGWTGANVARTGKNLIDPDDSYLPYSQGGATITKDGNGYSVSVSGVTGYPYVKVGTIHGLKAGTYSFTQGLPAGIGLRVIDRSVSPIKTYNSSQPFTVAEDVAHDIAVELTISGSLVADGTYSNILFQVEVGTTPTTYSPNSADTYSIAFPSEAGTVYGGTLDVTTGLLTVDKIHVAFTGAERFQMSTSASYPHLATITAVIPYIGVQTPFNGNKCTHYKPLTGGNLNESCFYLQTPPEHRNVSFNDIRFTTAEEFSQYFSEQYSNGTPVEIVYMLATPIEYTLTPTEVTTLLGTNNVWADTGDSTIKYIAPKAQIPSAQGVYF